MKLWHPIWTRIWVLAGFRMAASRSARISIPGLLPGAGPETQWSLSRDFKRSEVWPQELAHRWPRRRA